MRAVQLVIATALVLAGAAIPTLAQAPGKVQLKPEVEEFIGQMVSQNQFDEAALRRVFGQLKVHEGVVKAIGAPSTAKPWHEFRSIFVTPTRISGGLEFWQRHADLPGRRRRLRRPEYPPPGKGCCPNRRTGFVFVTRNRVS